MPKISIVTICRNAAPVLEKTIRSVLSQTDVEIEYVVIDGASTDETSDILRKYASSIDILVSEPDKGIVDAFNKGISMSTGEIVGLVNAGDFLEPGALSAVVKKFETDRCDVVYGDVRYWQKAKPDYIYKADHRKLKRFMSLNHPAVFVRKKLYERLGMFDEKYTLAMDYELMLRFYLAGAAFCYLDRVLSNMALEGISDRNWKRAYKEAYEIRKSLLGKHFSLLADYLVQVGKRHVSDFLANHGLEPLRKFYREKFSPIPKRTAE